MPEPRELRHLGARLPATTLETHANRPAPARSRGRRGRSGSVPVEVRNGLPFKPYRYRGVGWDIYSGEGEDDA